MKVLLCTIPLSPHIPRSEGQLPIMPKIAIVSLIKWMERYGYTRDMYDFYDIDMLTPSDDEIRNYFETYQPTVVGLSAVVSTTYLVVKRIAKILRQTCPDTWIVLGGNLSASANVVLRKTDVDVCIQGDGEIPWVEFLNYVKCNGRMWAFEKLSKIKGLTFINEGRELQFNGYGEKISSPEIPYPDYDILALGVKTSPEKLQNYFREGIGSDWFKTDPRSYEVNRRPKVAALWISKGCVAKCTFCQRSTSGYQVNDITKLEEHLSLLQEKYNVGFIQIIDENFGSDKRHTYEIAKIMKKFDMLWICGGIRCNSVTFEDIKFYYDNGCSGLKFGVESGSQKILDLMEKRFTVEQVYSAIEYCYENNVYSPLAVMTGMPGETDETAQQTGVFLGTIAHMQGTPPSQMGIGIFYALPLPGTPLYEYGQQVGVIGKSVDEEEKFLEAVSDAGADKENYINLNGASIKTVLFWDFLIRFEATRTFYRKQRRNLNYKKSMKSNLKKCDDRSETLLGKFMKPNKSKRLLSFLPRMVGFMVDRKLVHSPIIAKLPRPLVYIPLRNLIFAEFLLKKLLFRIVRMLGHERKIYNLYKKYKIPKQLTDDEVFSFQKQIHRSLRNIVRTRWNKLSTQYDSNRAESTKQ